MTDLVPLDDPAPERAPVRELQRWDAHPKWAMALRLALAAFPAVVGFIVMRVALALLPPAEAPGPPLLWFVTVAVAGVGVAVAADRSARRFLPLVAFLRLSMAFPNQAPSRFAVAMRTGTTKQLERRIKEIRDVGLAGVTEEHFGSMVLELAAALSVHDRLTRGHGERVRAYTDLIAQEMGLADDDMEKLRWASLLHDVGKLLVPREILNKPGRLTDDEFEIIKQHPLHGMRLVVPLRDWLGPWAHAVSQHHERWDGRGYPFGLASTEIHLGARIVAVADAFDVMTSARSYKAPMKVNEARAELTRCAGTQFDPAVVRAFLNVGLGRMHQLSGPLGILLNLGSLGGAPILPQAAPVVSGLVAASTMTVVGLPPTLQEQRPAEPAPVLAFADESAPESSIAVDGVTITVPGTEPSVGRSEATVAGGAVVSTTAPAPVEAGPSTTVAVVPGGASAPVSATGDSGSTSVTTTVPGRAGSGASPSTSVPPPSAPVTPPPGSPTTTTTAPPAATNLPVTGSLLVTEDGDGSWRVTGSGSVPQLSLTTDAGHGEVSVAAAADGAARWSATVGYRPDANYNGSDRVVVRSCRSGSCVESTVSVTVTSVNDAPTVAPIALTRSVCDQLSVADVMAGVSDVDGDPVTFVSAVRSNGGPVDLANLGSLGVGLQQVVVTATDSQGGQASGAVSVTTTAPLVSWESIGWGSPGPSLEACTGVSSVTWRLDGQEIGTSTGSVLEMFEAIDDWWGFLTDAFAWGPHTIVAVVHFADGSSMEQSTSYTIDWPDFGANRSADNGNGNSGPGGGNGNGNSGPGGGNG